MLVSNNSRLAVDFFVVLSGFATHWSNRRRRLELSPPDRWLGWCLRRTRKAVAAVWCTMALDAAVFLRYENWAGSGWLWFGGGGLARGVRCVALVNWWVEPHTLCPNNSSLEICVSALLGVQQRFIDIVNPATALH